ncbi:MAG: hypothetical protein IKQ70_00200 [Bacteroidales bacterium]|nr:hypothetical protein [Bacteroidales bacterium]
MFKSTEKKAQRIRQIVDEHYEPGRQDRCKLWVFRNYIAKEYGICQRTFFAYLSRASEVPSAPQATQLTLNFV